MSQSNTSIEHRVDKLLAEARAIRLAVAHGALPYSEAKERVKPLLEKVNRVGREIAKKYKVKYREIKFTNL